MCGATSYRPVIDRDASGALRPTSLFRCSGCSVAFTDPKAWRDGEAELQPDEASGIVKLTPDPGLLSAQGAVSAPQAPSFATYGQVPPSA